MTEPTTLDLPADNEILISRRFAAPAGVVFEVLTRPEHVRLWWAPASLGEMIECDIDLVVGGAWRFVMRANPGFEVGFSGTYLELEPPHRLVQTEIFDPFPDAISVVTLTLSDNAGDTMTTLQSRSVYPSQEIRDQVIATGMESGMRESYEQLAAAIERVCHEM